MKKKGFGVLAVLMLSMLLSVTAFAKGKWKVEEGNRYYYNEDGTKQKGWLTLKKGTYYFLCMCNDTVSVLRIFSELFPAAVC